MADRLEPVIESSDQLDHADPPNIFVTDQVGMHLRPDFIHHPNPLRKSERATPIYDQVVKALGWDPVAHDLPPWQWSKKRRRRFEYNKRAAKRAE